MLSNAQLCSAICIKMDYVTHKKCGYFLAKTFPMDWTYSNPDFFYFISLLSKLTRIIMNQEKNKTGFEMLELKKTEAQHVQPNWPLSFLKSTALGLSVTISFKFTMFGWFSCRRILISLTAVIGNPSFSLSVLTFFNATSSPNETREKSNLALNLKSILEKQFTLYLHSH